LKLRLAREYYDDIGAHTKGKCDFVVRVLGSATADPGSMQIAI
jgi:hypothetical protein